MRTRKIEVAAVMGLGELNPLAIGPLYPCMVLLRGTKHLIIPIEPFPLPLGFAERHPP
jgi:hypothetical protein